MTVLSEEVVTLFYTPEIYELSSEELNRSREEFLNRLAKESDWSKEYIVDKLVFKPLGGGGFRIVLRQPSPDEDGAEPVTNMGSATR